MSLLKDITCLFGNGADQEAQARFRESLVASLLVMAWMVEARDPYTGGHLWRVSRFARLLAEAAVRSHHETPDGKGYPLGLSGHDIPLDGRIVGICDAFDAITSARPYRPGMPIAIALAIVEENLGRQFDREFGERFIALGRRGALDHIVGHSDEGIPLRECMMCGPTLVLRKGQGAGEHVYCRSCTGEYVTEMHDGQLVAVPTGRTGSPKDLEPEADVGLIARFVRESAQALLVPA